MGRTRTGVSIWLVGLAGVISLLTKFPCQSNISNEKLGKFMQKEMRFLRQGAIQAWFSQSDTFKWQGPFCKPKPKNVKLRNLSFPQPYTLQETQNSVE